MKGGDYDVFVSYAHDDDVAASELNTWLRGQSLSTFFDRSELQQGLPWIPALEEAINRCRAVIILFGKHGIGNTQQYERQFALVRQAKEAAFPVIPVLMPGCASPPTGFLQLLTWVDLSKAASVLQQPDSLVSLRDALHGEAIAASGIRAQICPYRGLEPFREEDAPFFCGRDNAIHDLVAKVQAHAFVVVIGASGSGKSSLVFAGLLPALRKESQTQIWDVVSFQPGKWPLRALAAAFGSAPEHAGPAEIDAYLEKEATFYRDGNADTLARIIDRRLDTAPEKPDRLLIYVDQWEELYAMAPDAEDKERLRQHTSDVDKFIALLVAATSGARSRATVVLTVRADFYNPLVRSPLISALLPQQQVNIPLMGLGDLRSAIEKPAKNAGLSFTPPELVDQILNDVGSEEGRLPLLQFALKETWERRERNQLMAGAYTAVGGVTGAIEKTAQEAYNRLTPMQQDAARRLFLRLVTPGEGQEDTRARSLIPDDPLQRDVINLFANPKTRLLVTSFAPLQGSEHERSDVRATVEVAHEVLIQRWPTLQAWVNGNREKLRARAAILRAMAEWEENGEIDRYLLDPGVQLERGRSLVKDPGDVPVDDIRDFVDHSIKREEDRLAAEREAALADQKRIAEAERLAKEAAENAARQSEAARAAAEVARRKLRNRLAAAVSAVCVALLAFVWSAHEWRESQRQLDRANKALATGILADLDLKAENPLTARQRNALWKLATTDQAVHAQFVSVLSSSPADMARIAARFREVSRSFGLQWPSPDDAEKLFAPLLLQIGNTTDPDAFQALAEALGALAAKLIEAQAQAQQALDPLLQQIGKTANPYALQALADALQALAAKLTDAQAQQALDPLLQQIGNTANPYALQALAEALGALPVKLTEAQAQRALDPVLQQIRDAAYHNALPALAKALQGLAAKLTEAQAQQAFDSLLQQIGNVTDLVMFQLMLKMMGAKPTAAQAQQAPDPLSPQIGKTADPDVLQVLDKSLGALAAKLTQAQAQQTLDPLLEQIGNTTDPFTLRALSESLGALAGKLTEAQALQALNPLLQRMDNTTDPDALQVLAKALRALPVKLTEAQAQRALDPLSQQIGNTTDPRALQALGESLGALAGKLTEAQALQALNPLLQRMDNTTDPRALQALGESLGALAGKLTEAQALQALNLLLQWMDNRTDPNGRALGEALQALHPLSHEIRIRIPTAPRALQALAKTVGALAAKLTEAQAQGALDPLLQQIGNTTDPFALQALAEALGALPVKLTEAQAQGALDPLLQQIGNAANPDALQVLARALQALGAKLTEAQAQQALDPLLQQIGKTPDPGALRVLCESLRALPAKLTEAQSQQALDSLLQQIGKTANPDGLQALGEALGALAAKLTDAQAQHALTVAMSALAWAATGDEALDWARAVVALLPSASDQVGTRNLVAAIVYPAAAGPATEVLVDAFRQRHLDAPAKEVGTAATLGWIAEKYPNQVHNRICPTPPQPISLSGLKCPLEN